MDPMVLVDAVLDNQDKSDFEIIHAVESSISHQFPYNHEADSVDEACNRIPGGDERDSTYMEKEYDTLSEEIEALESTFTKREMAIMLGHCKRKLVRIKRAEESLAELIG